MLVKKKRKLQQLPSQVLLQEIHDYILQRPNRQSEKKRWIHYCCFLLCWKAGLRVTEAINFNLELVHPEEDYKELYLLQGKGQRQRYVFVGSEIIERLKENNWKPQQTNRKLFWEFLKKIRDDLQISASIELAPHTLRRCFATYNLMAGMPLNVLQKVLGHSKVTTTALYIKDSDIANLLKFKPI